MATTIPQPLSWAERLRAVGVTDAAWASGRVNPFALIAQALELDAWDLAGDLGCRRIVVELLLDGLADAVIDEVREGLRRQGLDDEAIVRAYTAWREAREVASWE